jgi:predicted transcriptional regulator
MTRNNKFMEIYRRFDACLKRNGFDSVKVYEESLTNDQFKQGQVRICRMIRNYIEHENSDFVEASDNMISFLEKITMEIDENETPVKKKMIPIKYGIKDTDLILVAADFMIKRKAQLIPIFDKTDYAIGAITQSDIVRCIAAGDFTKAKKVSAILTAPKFGFVKDWMTMKQVRPMLEGHDKIYLVLNDAKKVVGWIV